MALLGKNKKADTQNGFGTASSFQNQPENANWGNFGNDYGNTNGNPFGNNYGNGADNFGGSPFGGTGSFGGNDGFGTVNYNMTGGMSSLQQKTETHFSKSFLIVSIIASVIFFLLGEVIYRTLITDVNSVFFMGVYFAVFGLILSSAFFIVSRVIGLDITSKKILVSGICILMLLVLGIFFEFIYELNFGSTMVQTDKYIFAIDNSGSMQDNDPNQERVAAIKKLLANREDNAQFAVYSFGDVIQCIRELNPISNGIDDFATSPSGGTPIVGVLSKIMEDMESGTLPYDEGCQVILLTDGYATDTSFLNFELNKTLKKFNKKKISISTVGLGYVDEKLLNNISGKTGGISVTTDNVDELEKAMASAVRVTDSSRNLLSSRARTDHNWLYALMRIIFLIILGAGFLGIKLAATDDTTNVKMICISSMIGIVAGALVMEIGLNLILSEFFARLLMSVLFGLEKEESGEKVQEDNNANTEVTMPPEKEEVVTPTPEPTATPTPMPEITARLIDASEVNLEGFNEKFFNSALASSVIQQEKVSNDPIYAFDDDIQTSWQEGVVGSGIGESIVGYFSESCKVKYLMFRLGNWKTDRYFYGNNRPSCLRIQMEDFSTEINFPDKYQEFWVELSYPYETEYLSLTIEGVHAGTSWDDTPITDVRALGI